MVSTVFLGIDYSFADFYNPARNPILYETMIFGWVKRSWWRRVLGRIRKRWGEIEHDEYCERYPNRHAAQAGHDRAVAMVRGRLPV